MTIYKDTNANNVITGGSGDDTIYGLGGNDRLNGARGDDIVHGGNGNDTIQGGFGVDELWGGAGKDTFLWAAAGTGDAYELQADTVKDFGKGDKVDLTAVGLDGFGGYGDKGPEDGEFSIWYLGDDSYVTWFHDDMPRDIQFEGVRLTTADVIW